MATHPTKSLIADLRRPSGGLGGNLHGVEIDWEPGDPPIPCDKRITREWTALVRHQTIQGRLR